MQNFVSATTSAVALGTSVAVGDLIVAVCSRQASSNDLASDTCADSLGNTYTKGGAGYETVDIAGLCWFWCISAFAGTPTITVTHTATQPNRGLAVAGYRSSLGSPSLDVKTTLATHSSILGVGPPDNVLVGSITPSGSGRQIIAGFAQYSNNNAFTAGTGFAEDANTGAASISYTALESLTQGAAAGIIATGSDAGSAARYLGFAAAFAEPTAGGINKTGSGIIGRL